MNGKSLENSRFKELSLGNVHVAQLVISRCWEQEVPCLILGDFNVCFDFPLIRVAIALHIRKMEH